MINIFGRDSIELWNQLLVLTARALLHGGLKAVIFAWYGTLYVNAGPCGSLALLAFSMFFLHLGQFTWAVLMNLHCTISTKKSTASKKNVNCKMRANVRRLAESLLNVKNFEESSRTFWYLGKIGVLRSSGDNFLLVSSYKCNKKSYCYTYIYTYSYSFKNLPSQSPKFASRLVPLVKCKCK